MTPKRITPLATVSRILRGPLFIGLFLFLFASAIPTSAHVFVSQNHGSRTLQSATHKPASKPNVTPCTAPGIQPFTCVPGDGLASESGAVVAGAAIAADPNNPSALVVGGSDANCSAPFTNRGDASFYSTSNGGATWSAPYCMPGINAGSVGAFPAAGFDLNDNSYIAALGETTNDLTDIGVEQSCGSTWCGPISVIQPIYLMGNNPYGYMGDVKMQIDDHYLSPYSNCIYIATNQSDSGLTMSSITVSHYCGTWTPPPSAAWTTKVLQTVSLSSRKVGSIGMTIGKDGTVYVTWLLCDDTYPLGSGVCGKGKMSVLMISKSTDGGNTWSSPVVITKVVLVPFSPNTCGHSIGCIPGTDDEMADTPSIGIDQSNKLYVTYYTYANNLLQVRVRTSTNGGNTWSAAKSIKPFDPNHQFNAWLSVNSLTGTVGVTWMELYTALPNAGKYQEYGALSGDGGVTWTVSPPLSSGFSNPNNNGWWVPYIGDYMQNVWAPASPCGGPPTQYTLYTAWTDTRVNNDQLYVGGITSRY
jgi:hypothetical protein